MSTLTTMSKNVFLILFDLLDIYVGTSLHEMMLQRNCNVITYKNNSNIYLLMNTKISSALKIVT